MAIAPTSHALLSPSSAERWLHCPRAPHMEAELPQETTLRWRRGEPGPPAGRLQGAAVCQMRGGRPYPAGRVRP